MSNQVTLRPVLQTDLPVFYEQQLDPAATAMAAFPSREREPFMEHWDKIMHNESGLLRTVIFQHEVAGYMLSYMQDRQREVGYWLGGGYWGKGIATEALRQFLEEIETRPLFAHVAKHNIASRRVLEKCGFHVVGEDRALAAFPGEQIEEFVLKLER